ncbi:ABC transporter permease [Rathayibacter soli]|uniref:ABC transporter permease n=1 Tax=Rathayibacter soli TaxID=3144168 RepID=UPI0027E5A753|nr:ABC transporter permease [Glaciibacter superstes]
MTAVTPPAGTASAPSAASAFKAATVVVTSWKLPIIFGIFSIVSIVLFVVLGRPGNSTFSFATGTDFVHLPNITVSAVPVGIAVSIIAVLLTIASAIYVANGRKVPRWIGIVFSLVVLFGFLTWSVVGETLPIAGLLAGALGLSVPLIFGSMGGVLSERSGVVNIAIEGQLLAGAFTSAFVASITKSLTAGLIAAMVAGMLVSMLLAVFSITYIVDQVIVGVVLNVLIAGITGFLYSSLLANNTEAFNLPPSLPTVPIPVLSSIPLIGPVLFKQTLIVYLAYIAVALVAVFLFCTRWGLRVRSVGEHPQAADTVGINVNRTRFWAVTAGGAIAGLGGAYFTLGSGVGFVQNMTNGAGYIALAAVIFGRWDPIRATMAALLFGFADNLQSVLSLLNAPVPSEFMNMLPYVVTIFAVAGLVGFSRAPGADGKPYIKS